MYISKLNLRYMYYMHNYSANINVNKQVEFTTLHVLYACRPCSYAYNTCNVVNSTCLLTFMSAV